MLHLHACDSHLSRATCMVFRRQDGCAWDELQGACVTDLPCESRPAARCTYELTTGAPWDRTLNKCFMDADGACRWSDECTRIDGAAACASLRYARPGRAGGRGSAPLARHKKKREPAPLD